MSASAASPVPRRRAIARAHVAPRHATLAAGAAGTLLAGLLTGRAGALGAACGAAVVVGFLWSGLVPVLITRGTPTRAGLGLSVLLLTYTLRLALVLLALRLAMRTEALDRRALGLSIIACSLVWTAVHVRAVLASADTR